MTVPNRMSGGFAVRIFDLHAEVNGQIRTESLGQTFSIQQGEQRDIELRIEGLGMRVSFWLAVEAVAACHADEMQSVIHGLLSAIKNQPVIIFTEGMVDAVEAASLLLAKLDGQQ